MCFAVVGAAVLLESIWVFGHWLADGPHRVASGPTKIPWYIVVNAHAQEAVFGLIAVVFLFLWVIRPLLRRQPLPWDGLLLLAIPTTLWQMFGVGWFRWPASYNTAFINTNSWYERLPAWSSSNPRRLCRGTHLGPGYHDVLGPVPDLVLLHHAGDQEAVATTGECWLARLHGRLHLLL